MLQVDHLSTITVLWLHWYEFVPFYNSYRRNGCLPTINWTPEKENNSALQNWAIYILRSMFIVLQVNICSAHSCSLHCLC